MRTKASYLFLEFVRFVKGDLTNVHQSATVKNLILAESQWFTADSADVGKAYKDVYKNYKKWVVNGKRQGRYSRTNFSYEAMVDKLESILDSNIPEFPKQMELTLPKLNLPQLQKAEGAKELPKLKLPQLKKL